MNYYNDFDIASGERISILFAERNIYTFSEAAQYIKSLPYKRNKNKKNKRVVILPIRLRIEWSKIHYRQYSHPS